MTDTQAAKYLAFATEVAYEAGKIMKKYFANKPSARFKDDETIVTVADEEINSMVITRVNEMYPGHSIDGEEASQKNQSEYVWVCDPIDGTNPFAMELPVSVFSLALVIDGKSTIGVIYSPFTDHLYTAIKGKGAFLNGKPIRVSSRKITDKTKMNVDWWPGAAFDVMRPMHKFAYNTNTYILCPGSTTHAAALVARGEFEASVFPGTKGKNVDIAAAKVIVEEAGGRVTDLYGNEQRYDQDIAGAIISNGLVHDTIVEFLKVDLEDKDEI